MVRKARREKGMTQKALAVILGVPQSYVSKYELGERRIDLVETFEICRALDIDFVAFVRQFIRAVEPKGTSHVASSQNDTRSRRKNER